jgi:SdpI/YhfL family protein
LLAVPLVLGMVPPNRVYGVRTRRILADAGRWYAVNRVGGWCLLAASLGYLAMSAVLLPLGSAGDVASWLFHLAAFVGPLALGILVIQRYAKTR